MSKVSAAVATGFFIACLAGSVPVRAAEIGERQAEIEDGHLLAQRQCSGCHAIGSIGVSPRSDAPLFRNILKRYRADVLQEELVEGIKLGHPDMPRFQLNPKAVAALIAYLQSIQRDEVPPARSVVVPHKKPT